MKRQWGFDYTLMKGKQKVDGEVGLIFIAYLFTRMLNILGWNGIRETIANLLSLHFIPKSSLERLILDFQAIRNNFSQNRISYRFSVNTL